MLLALEQVSDRVYVHALHSRIVEVLVASTPLAHVALPHLESDRSSVHILHAGQEALSTVCATRNADKFADIEWQTGIGGAPIFNEFSARFQCRVEHRYEGGDHQIIVGRVLDYSCQNEPQQVQPLLFFKGKYCAVA